MSDTSFETSAVWYDGQTAVRHEGTAHWDPAGLLVLSEPGQPVSQVPLDDLRFAESLRDELVYTRETLPDFRLRLPSDMPPGLARHLPEKAKYGRWVDRIGLGPAAAAFTVVSVAAVALFMTAPSWLGPRIPPSWERQIGEAMIGDFGNRLCSTPAGDAALAKMLDAVDPAEEQVRAGVANIDMVNAVALPGAQVLLFDGLIQQAESPAELAGVLAHEVGHVRERHVMTAMLRQFGMSILLSGANTGLGDTLFGLASLGYSREAEREADTFARARMEESDISPLGAAAFFERISGEAGGDDAGDTSREENAVTGWMASHPAPGERALAFREAAEEGKTYPPVLTEEEFEALKTMCAEDPDVEEFEFF
ncbi:M48 family metallopeptidase [Erythrobacter sp. W53]|uniref:M48 family metallopeptidase n=1 Tax=Erythrobacter sp. W53 TaxID=3425947 RepID=UPI003D768A0F